MEICHEVVVVVGEMDATGMQYLETHRELVSGTGCKETATNISVFLAQGLCWMQRGGCLRTGRSSLCTTSECDLEGEAVFFIWRAQLQSAAGGRRRCGHQSRHFRGMQGAEMGDPRCGRPVLQFCGKTGGRAAEDRGASSLSPRNRPITSTAFSHAKTRRPGTSTI